MARPSLTKAHRGLLGLVAAGAVLISGIGFAGSYNAVRDLAAEKGFGTFSYAFPIGVDAGIVVLLALDLVLTWLRIPFPLLRQTAWLLTVATIAFNAAASWGDPLGMGMHAVIPVLFVVVVEASRHAVGRIADITADRHMESVRLMRWVLSPVPTFRLWRRMKLWELRSYDEVVRLEQNRLVYRAQLRFRYGRGWRRSAPIQALLPLKLAKYGVPLDPALLDRLDEEAREAENGSEARSLEPAAAAAAAAIAAAAPAVAPAGAAAQQAQALPGSAPQARPQAHPHPGLPAQGEQQDQVGGSAIPAVATELAVPMLAKLAAVRLRNAQEPDGAEQQTPAPPREELNVWTERRARGNGQAGRVPGQASPWFKPPREPEPETAAGGPATVVQPAPTVRLPQAQAPAEPYTESYEEQSAAYPAQPDGFPEEAEQPDGSTPEIGAPEANTPEANTPEANTPEANTPEPAQQVEPLPRSAASRLDPDLCFEALVTYIDTFGYQPDPQRLAAWLTKEYGAEGTLPDGSVHPKEVADLFPALQDRYVAAGRD